MPRTPVTRGGGWRALGLKAAEGNEAATFRANAIGPVLIGAHCAAAGIPLIQVSADYVFDRRTRRTDARRDTSRLKDIFSTQPQTCKLGLSRAIRAPHGP